MVKVDRIKNIWVARVTYAEKDIAKRAGFRWDPVNRWWWTADAKVAAKLSDEPTVTEAVEAQKETIELSRAHEIEDERIVDPPDGLEYMPFQKVAISFALDRKNVLLSDEMGLGKSIETIGIINSDPSINTVLIICPNTLKLNWQRELERWLARKFDVRIAYSQDFPNQFNSRRGVLIINYDIVKKFTAQLHSREWDCLVLDESHYVKSERSQRTRAILGHGKSELPIKAKRKLFLTGTPIPNRPVEGWTSFHALDPKTFPDWWHYAQRYCAAHNNGWGLDVSGAAHLDELQMKLRSSIMVRRKKEDVLKELPDKRRAVVEIPPEGASHVVSSEARAMASSAAYLAELKAAVELAKAEGKEAYENAVHKLRDAIRVTFDELAKLRHDTAVAKVPFVISFLEDMLEEQEKVVLFAWHHDVINPIVEHFGNKAVRLTGEDKLTDRQEAVDRFQNDPSCRLFVGSITAAGVGLTLTAASNVVFAELDWVPGNMTQAESRLHRIGQKDSVLVQHLVFDGSIDAKMAKKLVAKQKAIDQALDADIQMDSKGDPILPIDEDVATDFLTRKGVTQEAKKLTEEEINMVHEGLMLLADSDSDHASRMNSIGFSKIDSRVGHSLAEQKRLTAAQAVLGLRLCRKYRRQLPQELVEGLKLEVDNV